MQSLLFDTKINYIQIYNTLLAVTESKVGFTKELSCCTSWKCRTMNFQTKQKKTLLHLTVIPGSLSSSTGRVLTLQHLVGVGGHLQDQTVGNVLLERRTVAVLISGGLGSSASGALAL